jgi:hypothetical protein
MNTTRRVLAALASVATILTLSMPMANAAPDTTAPRGGAPVARQLPVAVGKTIIVRLPVSNVKVDVYESSYVPNCGHNRPCPTFLPTYVRQTNIHVDVRTTCLTDAKLNIISIKGSVVTVQATGLAHVGRICPMFVQTQTLTASSARIGVNPTIVDKTTGKVVYKNHKAV